MELSTITNVRLFERRELFKWLQITGKVMTSENQRKRITKWDRKCPDWQNWMRSVVTNNVMIYRECTIERNLWFYFHIIDPRVEEIFQLSTQKFDFGFVHYVTRLILYLNRHAFLQLCPISYDQQYKDKNFMIYIILAIKFLPLQTLLPHNRIELKKSRTFAWRVEIFLQLWDRLCENKIIHYVQ